MPTVTIQMFSWDAEKVFPDGLDAAHAMSDKDKEPAMKLALDLVAFIDSGGTILTTVPLAEPGRALVIGYVTAEDD